MNYYLFIPLLAFLANGFIIVYVFAQKKRDKIANAFLAYSIAISAWIAYNFYIWLPLDSEWIFLGMKYGAPSWMSIGFFINRFVYVFTKKKVDFFYRYSVVSLLAAILITLFSDWVIIGVNREYWGYSVVGGPLFLPITLCVLIPPILYSLFILLLEGYRAKSKTLKKQFFLLLLGFGAVLFLSVISVIILPHFFQIKIPSITSGAAVIQSLFTFYAIFRYRFLTLSVENVAEEVFSGVQDGVVLLNQSFFIEQMNDSAKRLFGISSGSRFGTSIMDLLPNCSPQSEYKNKELEITTDGGKKFLSLSHSFLKNSLIESGSLMIVRDVTEKKEDEEKIKKLYSMVLEDLEFARITQKALIAEKFPVSEYYKMRSLFAPVEKVGGDIINCRLKEDRSVDIFFADVSGHGVSAAMVASSATIAFNVSSERGLSPSEGLRNIHNLLSPTITQHHISAIYLNYRPETGKFTFSYAGHHPILRISQENEISDIEGSGMLLLAIPDPEFTNHQFELKKGEKILLYSDGLFEVRNSKNQLLGRNNFMKICRIAAEKNEDLLGYVSNYSVDFGDGNQTDDITLLLLERTG